MGVYLSSPITEKASDDKKCAKFTYGASSMQGWRMTQEDAHNCICDFDPQTSYFAVYDGHGGAEVAQYTAAHLPDYIKNHELYKEGKLAEALQEAFLGFDETLTEETVVQELKNLAGVGDDDEDNEMEDEEGMGRSERDMLVAEANMPIEELMAKYSSASALPQERLKEKFQSPAIRAKRTAVTEKSENGDQNTNASSESDALATSLEDRLEPDQPDNDNNVNAERELLDSQKPIKPKDGSVEPDSTDDTSDKQANINNSNSEVKAKVPVANGESSPIKDIKSSDKQSDTEVKTESLEPDSTSDKQEEKSNIDTSSNVSHSSSGQSSSSMVAECSTTEASGSGVGSSAVDSQSSSSGSSGSGSSGLASSSSAAAGSSGSGSSSGLSGFSAGSSSSSAGSSDSSSSAGPSGSEAGSSSAAEAGSSSMTEAGGSGLGKVGDSKKALIDEDFDSDDDDDTSEEEDDEEFLSDSEDDDDEDEEDSETGGIFGLRKAVANEDEDHSEEPGTDSGCTAVVVLMREGKVFVANAGDSRCVLCRDGQAVDLSFDHKPEDETERARIEAAGGKVTADGRVNGGLNLSRALGDHWYKRNEAKAAKEQMISALPDIESTSIGDSDEFLVIACDGIWNYLTSQETVDFIREKLKDPTKAEKPSLICEELFDHCLAPNTMGDGTGCDNMTCIIVVLNKPAISSGKRNCDELATLNEQQPEKRAKVDGEATDGVDSSGPPDSGT